MTYPEKQQLYPDKKYYVPVYKNEERLLHLSADTEKQAIKNAECMGVSWEQMKNNG